MTEIETLHDLIDDFAAHGARDAVLAMGADGMESWSFEELAEQSRRLASGFKDAGLEPGARAALLARAGPEWILACLALIQARAVPVLIDAQIGEEALHRILKDSGTSWVFTEGEIARRLPASGENAGLESVLLDAGEENHDSMRRFFAEKPLDSGRPEPGDLAVLFYTSGTSGAAKGVPLTHRNLASNLQALRERELVQSTDRALLPLPLHHVYPFTVGVLLPLACGIPIILPQSLTGPQIARAMTEGEATVVIGVPRIYAALFSAIEDRLGRRGRIPALLFRAALAASTGLCRRTGLNAGRRLFAKLHQEMAPKLHTVASGGSAIDPQLAHQLQGLGWRFANGYGLTETSPVLAFNEPGRARIGTVGRPLEGVEIRIADPEEGRSHGEILAKGPNVFSGYWNLEEKTAEAFTKDGFFRTGDLGAFDEDGYLRIFGRASSLIVLPGGENVRPEDVEETLEKSQWVGEAGVLLHENKLAAVVVADSGRSAGMDFAEVDRRVRGDVDRLSRKLPSHHRLAELAVTREPLARTRLGKIRRHLLEQRYEQLREGGQRGETRPGPIPVEEMSPEDQALLDIPAARQTWERLAERFPDHRLTPQTELQTGLGVDSMEWLSLGMEIQQRTGRELDEEAIGRIETVRDLLREVSETQAQATPEPRDLTNRLRRPEELLEDRHRRWLETPGVGARGLGRLLFSFDRQVLGRLLRLEVSGRENLPKSGPFVLVANHRSYLDAPMIAAALPQEILRNTIWGGATTVMFRNPLMRLASRATRVVPVDQQREHAASLALAATALERQSNLVWFPEGGISRDGSLQEFHPGIGIVLEAKSVPVVPVWVEGTQEALPFGSWRLRFRPVAVRFGRPVHPAEIPVEAAKEDDAPQRISQFLHDRVANLSEAGLPAG